jgi:hypothetical protein
MHLHPRPHMFTTALVACFSLILIEVRGGRSKKWLLYLPVLMVAWVNLHGGFLVGFILVAVFAADAVLSWARDRTAGGRKALALWLFGVLALCFAASLLNPAGWALWPHTTGYLGETYLVDFTQEYQSPDFHDALIKVFLLTLMFGTTILALLRSRIDALGLFLWVLFASFALHSGRNIPLFGVVCMPWLAKWTCDLMRSSDEESLARRFLRWAGSIQQVEDTLPGWPFALVGLVLMAAGTLNRSERFAFSAEVFPVAAVDYLRETGFVPPGPVYNEFIWGGYLLYAWPEVPVFIDGQTDFYGEALTREYQAIRFIKPGWQQLLKDRGIRWLIVPPDVPLAGAIGLLDNWKLYYSDETAAVYVASTGQ